MTEPGATYSVAGLPPRGEVRYVAPAQQQPPNKAKRGADPQLDDIIERLARIEAKLFVITNALTEAQSTQK
jgi:hypothetical protein